MIIKKGHNLILKNINLVIEKNDNIGIIGPMGAGKSTLLDAIAGRVFPFQGKIEKPNYKSNALVGRDYSFHKIVGAAYQYYQQRYQAFDAEIGPTVLEILQNQVVPIGTIDEKSVDRPAPLYAQEEIKRIADLMNIAHLLHRKVTTLSNGETRRTLIAFSLLKKPLFLLLDNPFTGLDQGSKEALKNTLDFLPQNGTQVILVAAESDFPSCINKRICLIDGQIEDFSKQPFKPLSISATGFKLEKSFASTYLKPQFDNFKIAVKFENTSVFYGQKAAVNQINWQVNMGECWALLGPNGSGKSTLLSLIMADNPQAYQNKMWLFDKKRGSGESIWDIKSKIGFVSPELHLFFNKEMAVWKVVASGLFDAAGLFKKITSEQEHQVNKTIEMLHLTGIIHRKIAELSLGEQRMVFLARALVKNPPLLLLDEACQNLDYSHMLSFKNLIDDLVKLTGKTLIYVTHNLEEIPECVDKILRLDNGKMI